MPLPTRTLASQPLRDLLPLHEWPQPLPPEDDHE